MTLTARTGMKSDASRWTEARIRRAKGVHAAISATYLYEWLLLAGFCAAGYIDLWIVLVYAACAITINGIVFALYRRGWNLRLADPSLFLSQQFCSIILALGVALVAPQIAFQPLGNLDRDELFRFHGAQA